MTEPIFENEIVEPARFRAVVVFPADADFFEGHFEGFPVLPGVVQLGTAARVAERRFGAPVAPAQIRRLKFAAVIRPGARIDFELTKEPEGVFSFRFFDAASDVVYSSGTLVYPGLP